VNCLPCAKNGSDSTAVALCPNCSAGLCLFHVQETARTPGPGTMNWACNHHTWDPASSSRPA